jgi:hypothetical protein
VYRPELVSVAEERELLERLASLRFDPIVLHGRAARTHGPALGPRSGYVLAGEARSAVQHSIPPAKELRYSIRFRTLRRRLEPDPRRWKA